MSWSLCFLFIAGGLAEVESDRQDEPKEIRYGNLIIFLAFVSFIWYIIVWLHVAIGLVTIYKRNTSVQRVNAEQSSAEGVTILRPLKGIDTEMEICLKSAFEQDYPNFQILFCVESADDPAVPVVKSLITEYPDIDAELLVGSEHYGPNPKINNLAKGYKAAKNDIIWVLDSNAWVASGTLGRSVAAFNRNSRVKLVHHLPMAISVSPQWDGNWGARLDEMFMLTAHSKFYSAINVLGVAPCVMGKSNLYRRSDLDAAAGGINGFAKFIAEDNMIAKALWDSGGRTAMTGDCVVQPQANIKLKGYIDRRVRWQRVRRYMVFAATLVEPTTESILSGVLGSFGISILFLEKPFSMWWFGFHISVWFLLDYWNFHNLLAFSNIDAGGSKPYFEVKYYSPEHDPKPRPLHSWAAVWALREILALPIWFKAMCGSVIIWRSRPFRIRKGDLAAEEIGVGNAIPFDTADTTGINISRPQSRAGRVV